MQKIRLGEYAAMDLPDLPNSILQVTRFRELPYGLAIEPMVDMHLVPFDGWLWTFPEHQYRELARQVCLLRRRA